MSVGCRLLSSFRLDERTPDADKAWATALSLALLHSHFNNKHAQWSLVERKALRWLSTFVEKHVIPGTVVDVDSIVAQLIGAAQTSVLVR